MESCPTQAVLPLVGLAADKVIRDRYSLKASVAHQCFILMSGGSQHHHPCIARARANSGKTRTILAPFS
ncbi:MAG: hypothetical protein ACQESR_14380 [Planctomycetota bacterium]